MTVANFVAAEAAKEAAVRTATAGVDFAPALEMFRVALVSSASSATRAYSSVPRSSSPGGADASGYRQHFP